jgi:cytochrome c oxidase subunit I+III
MFVTGIPHMALGFFSAASTLVAVPTAIQVFAWIGTMWKGTPRLHMPMLWILGFFATFVIGGLTGVMVAIVPFDWQVHDTSFITAHLHYVLVGGFVFPVLAGLYYWLPHLSGRTRFFRLGETAFWLIFLGFHGTFFLQHWSGLLGQRRRIHTYEAESGWELINLVSSVGGFIQAIGFALVIVDVVVNMALAVRGSRNPWGAGTLEWAMPTPAAAYNFASLPHVEARDALDHNPAIAVRIARGEGYLGTPRGTREVLTVDTATGAPQTIVTFPSNTARPVLMSAATGLFFLGFLLKQYWLPPISAVIVIAMAWSWAWSLGSREDRGLLDAGRGVQLPPAPERPGAPAWWGSVFFLFANATFFGSLLFGYAFLWTLAPNWPPPAWVAWTPLPPLLAAGGAAAASTGIRLAEARAGRGGAGAGLAIAALGLAALAGAAFLLLLAAPDPTGHAYGATVLVLAGYAALHAALALLLTTYCAARLRAGYISARRRTEIAIARLWTDYAGLAGLLSAAAILAPGLSP